MAMFHDRLIVPAKPRRSEQKSGAAVADPRVMLTILSDLVETDGERTIGPPRTKLVLVSLADLCSMTWSWRQGVFWNQESARQCSLD
jgi:hypothetical protein